MELDEGSRLFSHGLGRLPKSVKVGLRLRPGEAHALLSNLSIVDHTETSVRKTQSVAPGTVAVFAIR